MQRFLGARLPRAMVAAVVLSLALTSAPAVAKTPAKSKKAAATKPLLVAPGTRYLALGDSVTFGYEESSVVPAPDYSNAASFLGYPEHLGAALHLTVANPACPGETSSSFINTSAPSNGCENTPGAGNVGYRTLDPLHVSYKGSQLAYALSYLKKYKNVSLVSLMIGANDGFRCQETTADHCTSAAELSAVTTTISKNVKTILSAIRNKAHYNGQLVILNYYSLDYANPLDNVQSLLVNKAMDSAAKPFHVLLADGYGEFEAASVHSGNDSCTAGLLTMLSTGGCGVHPSYAGQSLLAESIEKVIKEG